MYRQGDVLLIPVKSIDKSATEKPSTGKVVLALGEVTGHHHRFEDFEPRTICQFFKDGDTLPSFISLTEPLGLKHEEHATITVAPGNYAVRHQREFDMMAGVRRVMD